MTVDPIRTRKVTPRCCTLVKLLDESLTELGETNVLAISSKIVALCEGRVVAREVLKNKEELIRSEADLFLPASFSQYNVALSVTRNTLIPMAGIDESNAGDYYVLWPADPQRTANDVRAYLCERFQLKHAGVIITDSTARPLRWGAGGFAIAHSGFKALRDYRGKADLFGRTFLIETMDVSGGLAAAATVVMGEGSEQTPLARMQHVSFVEFQEGNPSPEELAFLRITLKDDLYAPLLQRLPWQRGGRKNR